jgi:hypothetical protein
MADKTLVVSLDQMPDWLEKRRKIMGEIDTQLIRGLQEPGKGLTLDHLQATAEHRNPFEAKVPSVLEALVDVTQKKLQKFFRVDIESLPSEFTEENLAKWAEFGFKPVYLPMEEIGENRKFKKNWTKPEKWFYQKIGEGKISADGAKLYRGWYLADFTVGVDYTDGTQVFPDDRFAPIIAKLREEGKIGKYDNTPLGSRFAITNDEWRDVVCPVIAEALGFKPQQVRLERAIEFNAIGNIYDPNRGKFNMWEWFSDKFADSRWLCGGGREHGGLAHVDCDWSGVRYDVIAGRPLVSFAK